jgi:hypothetical protein
VFYEKNRAYRKTYGGELLDTMVPFVVLAFLQKCAGEWESVF